jgi:hypothetical protein
MTFVPSESDANALIEMFRWRVEKLHCQPWESVM